MLADLAYLLYLHYLIYNHDHHLFLFLFMIYKLLEIPYMYLKIYIDAALKRPSVYSLSWRSCSCSSLCTYFKHVPLTIAALDLSRSCSPWPEHEKKGKCPPVAAHLETRLTAMEALGHLPRNKCVATTVRTKKRDVTNNATNQHLAPIDEPDADDTHNATLCTDQPGPTKKGMSIVTLSLQLSQHQTGSHTRTTAARRRV